MAGPFDKYSLAVNKYPEPSGSRRFELVYNKRPDLTHYLRGRYIPAGFQFDLQNSEGQKYTTVARSPSELRDILTSYVSSPKDIVRVEKIPPSLYGGVLDISGPHYPNSMSLTEKHQKVSENPQDGLTKKEVEIGLQLLGRKFPDATHIEGWRVTGAKQGLDIKQSFTLPKFRAEARLRRRAQRLEKLERK